LPERDILGIPLSEDFRQWLAAVHFQKEQAALVRRRRAQVQNDPRNASLRNLSVGQHWK
jgi:hypothetical protein